MQPTRRARGLVIALFALALTTVACADEEAAVTAAPPVADKDCVPKTCSDFTSAKVHDDGCGETIDCSKPTGAGGGGGDGGACKPKTCADLGKTSGSADDGCGKTLQCGDTSCDDGRGNHTSETALNLGEMTDFLDVEEQVATDLKLGNDEAWFKVKVRDLGVNGNPLVRATATVSNAEVSVFYVCDAQPDDSSCAGGGTPDATLGRGCKGTGGVTVSSSCSGLSEDGVAFVRVKKSAPDAQCIAYDLSVRVVAEANGF